MIFRGLHFNLTPSIEERKKWDVLAYVTEAERKRIMALSELDRKRTYKLINEGLEYADKRGIRA